ncbi:DUF951 domain-containing protein [Bacilliculturomica massiliensis]|uniref:DUF951 domain-containing protein n=1 Tax=Bacilliculturomica massiliensis TaxID=1917867 RepID=UPI001A925F0B|nr:DUF951 domain-containing protein [Bacilliculturomica massiliensis]
MPMKIEVGDSLQLKKPHACGGNSFTVRRAGMDFRIECANCGAQIWMKRTDLEKRIRKISPKE